MQILPNKNWRKAIMEKVNLKGKTDELVYFRKQETGNKIARKRMRKGIEELYYVPETKEIRFTEQDIKNFSLDEYGDHITYVEGDLTIFNNYFFDFWGYYLGAEATALYGHLKRYAYGDKDWCYPSMELIAAKMNKTPNSIRAYTKILERYGFVYKINVRNKNRSLKTDTEEFAEESPIYKIRKQIPLLSKELIEGNKELDINFYQKEDKVIQKAINLEIKGLPNVLRKEHNKYLEKMKKNNQLDIQIKDQLNFDLAYVDLISRGAIYEKYNQHLKDSQKTLQLTLSDIENDLLERFLEEARKRVSKPSWDTFFKPLRIRLTDELVKVIAPSAIFDYLQNRYTDVINEIFVEVDHRERQIELIKYD